MRAKTNGRILAGAEMLNAILNSQIEMAMYAVRANRSRILNVASSLHPGPPSSCYLYPQRTSSHERPAHLFQRTPFLLLALACCGPIAVDTGQTAKDYAIDGWPSYFLIDRDGKVRSAYGGRPPTEDQVKELL